MDPLIMHYENLLSFINDTFFRFNFNKINWKQRMVAIKGPRGAGKTTLMLQYIKYELKNHEEALYVSLDHPWFYTHSLLDLAQDFYKYGGKYLFIDEVHKYPFWSRELKTIYDGIPGLKIVFSASSALDIYRGEADLSRRVITYELPGMSFREFLELKYQKKFTAVAFEELLKNHVKLAREISQQIRPLPLFKEYLTRGYYPFSVESEKAEYFMKINQAINAIIESDLAATEGYSAGSVLKLKKLLGVIAESVPFQPNISSIARKLEVSRDSVYQYLHYLQKARLLNFISSEGKGTSTLQKPEKIYLENPNLNYALKHEPEKGNVRETFLLNQLINSGLEVHLPAKGDFLVSKKYLLESGGKSKGRVQIKDQKNAIIVADETEVGFANKIPHWLFGFLY